MSFFVWNLNHKSSVKPWSEKLSDKEKCEAALLYLNESINLNQWLDKKVCKIKINE